MASVALALLANVLALAAAAEEPPMHAGMLAHALDRIANTARVLYIAAHPDDENTRLLAYLANARHVTVAYLSMTRGGGGQNLIGREQDELLDVLRTEELLAARQIDGATQRFTRMRDFGYSKTGDETLRIWGHDEALADVVWVIRTFQPDVVIARFDELPPNHGHHTASAILAREAFAAAADPARYPWQLADGVAPWQADRLLLNVPTWREGPPPAGAIALDVGAYDARLGLGYVDLAARSRSQHKSQGFGVSGERGPVIERFVSLAGTKPSADILEGLDLTWQRDGAAAEPLIEALETARERLDRDHPERALPALLDAHAALDRLTDSPRARDARAALADTIAAAAGLYFRAWAARGGAVPGSRVPVQVEISLRQPATMILRRVAFAPGVAQEPNAPLVRHEKKIVTSEVVIPADSPVSTPYWLAQPVLAGRQVVADPRWVGAPRGPSALTVDVALASDGHTVHLAVPVQYAWNDPVEGERTRAFQVIPPATVTASRNAVMFPNGQPATAVLRVRAGLDDLRGEVSLPLPDGWRAVPDRVPVALARAGDETTVRFTVTPPKHGDPIDVEPQITVDGHAWRYREDTINYAHIPMQIVLQPSRLRMVPLTIRLPKGRIGYIEGSGDTIAADLAHLGLTVERLEDETIRGGDLDGYRAIIVGIRAYNTRDALRGAHARLMDYVERGGTVVVQYTTNNRLAPLDLAIGPYPLTIGRERITDETAELVALQPRHPTLSSPNRIDAADFADWVQERGLYFAESWDPRYQPILRAADPGEQALDGGLLVARHGRGRYVYTGLAFFRQLPAGVAGAYRLLVNLITTPEGGRISR